MLDSGDPPQWLTSLLGENFFSACIVHEEAKKNEKNIFCLDCSESICSHCLPTHGSHCLLQIRRYVYRDVIRLIDAEKLMDCAFVQSYITNSARVVFLNPRAQSRPCRGVANLCFTCARGLQDPYLFCSLFCKLQHILKTEGGLSNHLYKCEFLSLPEPGLDDYQMTPDTVLDQTGSMKTESGSSASGGAAGLMGCLAISCTATTEIVRKKRSSSGYRSACRPVYSPVSEMTVAMMNRRKGTRPQRSPLY